MQPDKEPGVKASRPLLKWAGGKSQLISQLTQALPLHFEKYIEPFVGGGALFFHLGPAKAVIGDSNPELISLYKQIALNHKAVLKLLKGMPNREDFFYEERSKQFSALDPVEAAARTIYLNRTCFNGLYRVNKTGQFNVPYGRYKNPMIADASLLESAAQVLKTTTVVLGDYTDVLRMFAQTGDAVFLDPPYVPISKNSDFKRYTKDQFKEQDHRELAEEVERLCRLGCHVVVTNSNHPLVYELYREYRIQVIQTRRSINSRSELRSGEDLIITASPRRKMRRVASNEIAFDQIEKFPSTRFMGSKHKLLSNISSAVDKFAYSSVVDLFSGSGIVGYMFKAKGKRVVANDHMSMAHVMAKALIENNSTRLSVSKAASLMAPNRQSDKFVSTTFSDIYFSKEENELIDNIRANIKQLNSEYEIAIAKSALIRACIKKRPRGVFTYIGNRYDDGRRDLRISLQQHFMDSVEALNQAVFDNGKTNVAKNVDAMDLKCDRESLIYIDPPYFTPKSDSDYVRRYHFVEGIARDWKGVDIQVGTKTKKFKGYPTPFSTEAGATMAFGELFARFSKNILVVSYSSNSLPSLPQMIALLRRFKGNVEVFPVKYKYSFGNQKRNVAANRNVVTEYIFIAY